MLLRKYVEASRRKEHVGRGGDPLLIYRIPGLVIWDAGK